jgi:hypothetical protein
MIRSAALLLLITACSSDYKVHDRGDEKDPGEDVEEEELVEELEDELFELDTAEPDPEPEVDAPIALCEVTPDKVRPIVEGATWLGRDSYDPNDLAISYEWTLVYKPDGSAAEMPMASLTVPDRADFNTDLAGEYIGRLVVTNSEGVRSDPCEATLDAEPVEALWVEMFWENGGDDMDLHLLAPDGEIGTDTDCYYGNCTDSDWGGGLDWGVSGDTIDDPILDLDDISETGPENINIEMPQDGEFRVVVHDYPGSVYDGGNPVTINVYLDGELEWTETRTITTEDSYTEFALINTRTAEVTPL